MAEKMNINDAQKTGAFRRMDDFIAEYANNFQLEQSTFDLKLIFGQLDQSEGAAVIQQHTAMTIPWASAKLLMYYLQLNIAGYELQNGKIKIPNELIPPPADRLPKEEEESNPNLKKLFDLVESLRKQFIENL